MRTRSLPHRPTFALESFDGLWRRGIRAGLAAAIFNFGLYMVGMMLGIFSTISLFAPPGNEPRLAPVLIASIVGTAAATAVYRALAAHSRHPVLILGVLAAVVLLLSFVAVTGQAQWSRTQIAMLELMHIAVATGAVTALWDWDRTQRAGPHTPNTSV